MANEGITARQEAFCVALEIDGLTQRQAYIKAYGRGNYSDDTLDQKASKMAKRDKVRARCEELREKVTERAVWSRLEMIETLKAVADECKDARIPLYNNYGDLVGDKLDASARSVAVKAIDTASKMLGYNAPQKVEHGGTVSIESYLTKVKGEEY